MMLYEYFDDVPGELVEEFNALGQRNDSLGPLHQALLIWLDRNLPARYRVDFTTGQAAVKSPSFGGAVVAHPIRSRMHPANGWRNRASFWFPVPAEVEECCKTLALPKVPWGFKQHCSTIRHIGLKCGVEPKELQDEIYGFLGPYRENKAHTTRCISCGKFLPKDKSFCESCI